MNNQAFVILVGLLCLTSIAYAGVSANYDLSWNVIGGGGGAMDSASYGMRSAVGQAAIGLSDSDNYQLGAGYWNGISAVSTSTTPLKGDLNRDGFITNADAVICLQIAVGSRPCNATMLAAADVSRDDSVTSLDALMILQAAYREY